MRFLCYALGAGAGHLTRAIAITTRVRDLTGATCAILTNSFAAHLATLHGIPCYRLPSRTELPFFDQGPLIRSTIDVFAPNLLAVDTFADGYYGELGGHLSALPGRKVFIHRRGQVDGDLSSYDLVCDIEAITVRDGHHFVSPVLIRDPNSLLSRAEARRVLRADPESRVVFAFHCGRRDEARRLFRTASKAVAALGRSDVVLRFGSLDPTVCAKFPELSVGHFPAAELLPGVDVAIVAGGYNSYYEIAATGTPAVFVPLPREIDDQLARVAGEDTVARCFQDVLDLLKRQLDEPRPARGVIVERNGLDPLGETLASLMDVKQQSPLSMAKS